MPDQLPQTRNLEIKPIIHATLLLRGTFTPEVKWMLLVETYFACIDILTCVDLHLTNLM